MTAARHDQSLEGDWRAAAACLDEPRPDVFFPVGADRALAEPAKAYCRRCPVVRACLAEAIRHDVAGVWGGTTEDERDALRQRFGVTAEPITQLNAIDSPAALAIHLTGGGCSAAEIADRLGTTPRTIQRYRRVHRGLSDDD